MNMRLNFFCFKPSSSKFDISKVILSKFYALNTKYCCLDMYMNIGNVVTKWQKNMTSVLIF